MDTIPTQLSEIRRMSGTTQTAISAACGVTQSMISDFERGERVPSLAQLECIAKACGCDLQVRFIRAGQRYTEYERLALRIESMSADERELVDLCVKNVASLPDYVYDAVRALLMGPTNEAP